jgi:hypothetical protein
MTGTTPAFASSVDGTLTTIDVPVCDITVTPVPLNVTADVEMKFVPVIVTVVAGDPAGALDGESAVTVGAGF